MVLLLTSTDYFYLILCTSQCGIQEMARMAKYGLTTYELELNMAGLLKDVQQTAEQEDTLKSITLLEEIMDCNDLSTAPQSLLPSLHHLMKTVLPPPPQQPLCRQSNAQPEGGIRASSATSADHQVGGGERTCSTRLPAIFGTVCTGIHERDDGRWCRRRRGR